MSFHTNTQFTDLQGDLAALFEATASQYAKNAGLEPLAADSLRQMSVSLDQVAGEVLMFGCDAWPESAQTTGSAIPFEVNPSEVDPPHPARLKPWAWQLGIVAIAASATVLMTDTLGVADTLFYTIGVMVVATMFGSYQALAHSAMASLLNNFFSVPPVFAFSVPTRCEVIKLAYWVTLALVVPWVIKQAKERPRHLAGSLVR